MENDIKALADAIYRDKVRRARALTEGARFDTGIELFEGALGLMEDGVRAQFPELDEDGVNAAVRARLTRIRRMEEHGIYQPASH